MNRNGKTFVYNKKTFHNTILKQDITQKKLEL